MDIRRLDHIHIYSRAPQASAEFYVTRFGAEIVGTTRTTHGSTMFFVRLGGLALVLAPHPPLTDPVQPQTYTDGAYQGNVGVSHFGLEVDDVSDAVDHLRSLDVRVLTEPRENAGLRFAYVAAPDGVIIELLQYSGAWKQWLGAPRSA